VDRGWEVGVRMPAGITFYSGSICNYIVHTHAHAHAGTQIVDISDDAAK